MKDNCPLILTKVRVLNNPTIEKTFNAKYEAFCNSTKNEIPWMSNDNTHSHQEWKNWILSQFSRYVKNVSG